MTPGVHSLVKASAVQALDSLHAPIHPVTKAGTQVVYQKPAVQQEQQQPSTEPNMLSKILSHSVHTNAAWPAEQQAGLHDALTSLQQQLAVHKLECNYTSTRCCMCNSNWRGS